MAEADTDAPLADEIEQNDIFERILDEKIKYGQYQNQTLSVVGLIEFLDGAEYFFLVLLTAILTQEWKLEGSQVTTFSSMYFIGVFCGYFLSGIVSEALGRKRSLIIVASCQIVVTFYTAFIYELWVMLTVRYFYGLLIGINLPIGIVIISEISPAKYRGRITTIMQLFLTLGKFYTILLGYIFLDDISSGNWRAIALMNTIPCALILIGTLAILRESTRFLVVNKPTFDKGFQQLQIMGKQNNGENNVELTDNQRAELLKWRNFYFDDSYTIKNRFGLIFTEQKIGMTIRLCLFQFIGMFMFSSYNFLLPFILSAEKKNFWDMFLSVSSQLPAVILVYLIIDNQSIGRINLIAWTCFIQFVLYIVFFYARENTLVIGMAVLAFMTKFTFMLFFPICIQSFSTIERSIALGFTASFGRLGALIAPYLIYDIYLANNYAPFLVYAVSAGIIFVTMITYPIDNTGQSMQSQIKQPKHHGIPDISDKSHDSGDREHHQIPSQPIDISEQTPLKQTQEVEKQYESTN